MYYAIMQKTYTCFLGGNFMKKSIALLLALITLLSTAACGKESGTETKETKPAETKAPV